MLTAERDTILQEVQGLIAERRFLELRRTLAGLEPPDLADLIVALGRESEAVVFRLLPRSLSVRTFEHLPVEIQEELIKALGDRAVATILDDMSPDDRTALLEELPGMVTRRLINMLSPEEREVATRLLGYPEESVGRLMTPDYVAIKPHWTVAQVLEHVRRFGRGSETLNVLYVVESGGRLIDDLRISEVLLAQPETRVEAFMDRQFVALSAYDDQETATALFRRHDRSALPVIDNEGILVGIVTVDDVLDVLEEEATEDIHKLGGMEALEEPYMNVGLFTLVRKRAVWLVLLFFGQMLTATAMGFFEDEIARALVLAIFVPLIISSGGNTGSQAATLIIRALTLGEVRLRDWARVMRREILTGLIIGGILGSLGFLRIAVVHGFTGNYGEHWFLIALTIALALLGVVLWGTLSGSLLPFLLRRLGLDPAASSAPFVATLCDVTGLLIYFGIAILVLRGTVL
jgi:magnesium transporter